MISLLAYAYKHQVSSSGADGANLDEHTSKSIDLNSQNRKGQTALHIAVNKGYANVARMLLRLGADPSLQDKEGDTSLHDAVTKRNDQLVEILLDSSINLGVSNKLGFNALHHIVLMDNCRLVVSLSL